MPAYSGLIVDVGLQEALNALSNGWTIDISHFAVTSQTPQPLSSLRENFLLPDYYAPVGSYRIINPNKILVTCVVPEYGDGAPPTEFRDGVSVPFEVTEVYLFITNKDGVEKLFWIGQPEDTIVYNNNGNLFFDVIISMTAIEQVVTFNSTQATEIETHNEDPNAHPGIVAKLAENTEWIKHLDTSASYVNAASFTTEGDLTARFTTGRRVKITLGTGAGAADYYTHVDSVSFDGTLTTVVLADAVLDVTLSAIYYGIISTDPSVRSIKASDSTDLDDDRTLATSRAVYSLRYGIGGVGVDASTLGGYEASEFVLASEINTYDIDLGTLD